MTSRASTTASRRSAFTMAELLVVIGILFVLVAMLLPTLGRAKANAASASCLSNLRQIGQAALLYASEHDGILMPCQYDAIQRLPVPSRQWIVKQYNVDPNQTDPPPGVMMFFCPSNEISASNLPTAFATSGLIRYWYTANPWDPLDPAGPMRDRQPSEMPRGSARWFDTNGNGTNRDEYLRNIRDRNAANIVICTDHSRQDTAGWYMIHGTGGGSPSSDVNKRVKNSWKNNLYGDGRAESVRPDQVIKRWGPANPAGW